MSKYKRLTRYSGEVMQEDCRNCNYAYNNVCNYKDKENKIIYDIDEDCKKVMLNRLAELEDKIENGTLIDTKVKIGQRVFRRGFFKGEIDEYIVSNIVLENGKLKVHLKHDFDGHKTCYSATVLDIEEIGKTVFLNPELLEVEE